MNLHQLWTANPNRKSHLWNKKKSNSRLNAWMQCVHICKIFFFSFLIKYDKYVCADAKRECKKWYNLKMNSNMVGYSLYSTLHISHPYSRNNNSNNKLDTYKRGWMYKSKWKVNGFIFLFFFGCDETQTLTDCV